MFKQLLARLQPKSKRTLGFRINRELDDCSEDIMGVFGATDFRPGYEDSWEWFTGESTEGLQVNISRPHDRQAGRGDYDVPVIVHVSGPTPHLTDELFAGYAQQLATRLRAEVWAGRIVPGKSERHYDFEIGNSFRPAA